MIQVENDETGTIRVKGSADIHHALELHTKLTEILKAQTEDLALTMDLGELTDLDTAGVQILISFRQSVPSVRVHSCPQRLREMLDRTGLVRLLV